MRRGAVAPYSSQRPVAVEAMTSPDSFLVCRTGGNGQPLLVMSCDKQTLRWLAGAFDAIGKGSAFRLGDGRPVGSDDQCLVTVAPIPGRQRAVMTRLADRRFQWLLPVDEAHRVAGLVRATITWRQTIRTCRPSWSAVASMTRIRYEECARPSRSRQALVMPPSMVTVWFGRLAEPLQWDTGVGVT
jgi:hypothetical protein